MKKFLAELEEVVMRLLREAVKLSGCVVIVTLAKSPWVMTSSRNFMPRLHALLHSLELPIVYAREAKFPPQEVFPQGSDRRDFVDAMLAHANEEEGHWVLAKGRAIAVGVGC